MEHKKITIITPSFNQGEYIEQTIDSVLSQNYPNLEYFVVDGGSTDRSKQIIRKYEKHLTWWVSEPDNGQSDAINKGLRRVSGDIVNWLNSDDYYEPDTLKIVNEAFSSKDIKCLCGRSVLFNEEEVLSTSRGTDVYQGNLNKTLGWARIDQPETFFRADVVSKMGLLLNNLDYIMDKEWWIRFLFQNGLEGIHTISDVLVNFRYHPSSKTVSQSKYFAEEPMQLYLTYAEHYGFATESNFLETLIKEERKLIDVSNNFNKSIVKGMLHYFLLLKAHEYYANNDKANVEGCMNILDTSVLDQADMKLVKRIKMRNKLPISVIKFLRKFTE